MIIAIGLKKGARSTRSRQQRLILKILNINWKSYAKNVTPISKRGFSVALQSSFLFNYVVKIETVVLVLDWVEKIALVDDHARKWPPGIMGNLIFRGIFLFRLGNYLNKH